MLLLMALCTSLCPTLKVHVHLRGTLVRSQLCDHIKVLSSLSLSGSMSLSLSLVLNLQMEGRNVAGGVTQKQILISCPNFEMYPGNLIGSTCGILRLGVIVSAHPPS